MRDGSVCPVLREIFIATGMSLTGTGTGYMTLETKQVAVICSQVPSKEHSDLSAEDKSYSASFPLLGLANACLAFGLFLVASSYFLLSKNLNFFGNCRLKPAEEVSIPDRIITNSRTENDATALNSKVNCSESTRSSHKFDAYSEISDLDRTIYLDSLLNLELEEDTEWLSDSLPYGCSFQNPSTPLSYKSDSFPEISDMGSPSYWDSLLRLEENYSDRESYFDSLLSLEDEDTEWLSFEDPSTPLSHKCESLSESDIGSPSYWDSLLRLEEKDNEWISDSKQALLSEWTYKGSWGALSSVSTVSSLTTRVHCNRTEEFSGDEPLFWPFEEELNWNSEESWTPSCSSPRRRLVFEATPPTPRIKECKQKSNDALYSVKSETSRLSMWSKSSAKIIVPLECDDDLSKTFLNDNFASNNDHPIEILLGLKEFDGHEGLDSEFNGNVFMLD